MQYRHLGKSGLRLSIAGLGSSSFGARCDANDSARIIGKALDLGVNFIDTANVYNGGLAEEYVGKAIRGRRLDVAIATKFSSQMGEGPFSSGASRRHIQDAVHGSLRRLGVDTIDLYQLHFWDGSTPIEETLRALDDLVRAGDVCYIGCSNFVAWQVVEAQWVSRTEHLASFCSAQNLYNMLDREIESELVAVCGRYGLGILPYFPLGGGFLTGQFKPGQPVPSESRLAVAKLGGRPLSPHALRDEKFARMERLERLAQGYGRPVTELALAWLGSQPHVSSVIAGASSVQQVEQNVRALEWQMTPEELSAIDLLLTGDNGETNAPAAQPTS